MTTIKDILEGGGVPLYDTRKPFEKSLEEIVANHKEAEFKRRMNAEPPEQAVIFEHVRETPQCLLVSLGSVASRLRVNRSVLTRCLSHQVVSWYRDCLGLEMLCSQYADLFEQVRQRVCCMSLRRQMQQKGKFNFHNTEPASTSVSSVAWVRTTLAVYGDLLGARWSELLLSGLAWSLTTLEHKEWDEENVETFFKPEVLSVEMFVSDTTIDFDCYSKKFAQRMVRKLEG